MLCLGAVVVATVLLSVCGEEDSCPGSEKPQHHPPRIQLRAVLIRCPYQDKYVTYKNKAEDPEVALSRGKEILQFYGFDVDEPLIHSEVIHCRRKLVITIKLAHSGKFKKEAEYVVVDHAYDPVTKEKVRLLNPIVLRINQEPVMQAYPMNIVHIVNAEATEEVIHKGNTPSYKGCNSGVFAPTCGHAFFKSKRIPFSEGFCCSCDGLENLKRQPVESNHMVLKTDMAYAQQSGKIPQPLKVIDLKKYKKEHQREKRYYPVFPKTYYNYPPMEPAKGFVSPPIVVKASQGIVIPISLGRSDFKSPGSGDPWEPAPPASCYVKEIAAAKATTYNPFFHILQKRFGNVSRKLVSDQKYGIGRDSIGLRGGLENLFKATDDAVNKSLNPAQGELSAVSDYFCQLNGTGEADLLRRRGRQVSSSGTQVRGGQDCVDRSTPCMVDPITYHESAHCLRFSELWYTVYGLREPFISHVVNLDVFEKRCINPVKNHWLLTSRGIKAEVGTFQRRVMDKEPTKVFSYTPLDSIQDDYICLATREAVLLVPNKLPKRKINEYPQAFESSGKFLLLHPRDVVIDGDECDKAGVSYIAFAKQPYRCEVKKGTCLSNQPMHMWKHDTEKKAKGEKGKYFLDNFADVPQNAIKIVDKKKYLTIHYEGPYSSVVEMEYKADSNGIVRKESTVQISEIYVDSTCEFHTKITVLVTNTGLVSSMFRPRMTNCPVNIPAVWSQQEGPLVVIAPQRKHVYRLSLYGPTPSYRFHCSIEMLNSQRKIVAVRRIKIQKFDRCICMWHCLCTCSGAESLKCNPMTLEHFHAAGFRGSMSVDTSDFYIDHSKVLFLMIIGKLLKMILAMHVYLLIFGLLKAIIGAFFSQKIAHLFLDLVCPLAMKHIRKEKRRMRFIEFFYNTICFYVIPGQLVFSVIIIFIRSCINFLANLRKTKSRASSKKKVSK